MNKKLTILILLALTLPIFKTNFAQSVTPCLISKGIVSSGGCSSIGDPDVNDCFAGIQRQIARSVLAENLASWIYPDKCWGWVGPTGEYLEGLIPSETTEVNCTRPYDRCYGNYCPNKYCDIIKSFVDIKASLIVRAANYWGADGNMKPGTNYYNAIRQIVIDINAAYDCANLRRPVIQGCIMEYCAESVNTVPIPTHVINKFRYDVGFTSYYLDIAGNPKTTLKFSHGRITSAAKPNVPDISKIEAKMWFYYLASSYIDLGYRSIHMGQMKEWGFNDSSWGHTINIIDKIRSYAISKGTFVLLTEENYKAIKYPGTDNFLFDYDSRVLWPREISFPQVASSVPCPTPITDYLAGTACTYSTKAVIDPCVIQQQGNTGGYGPYTGCYMQNMPFNTYFDFGDRDFGTPFVPVSSPEQSVWGWEDTKWFGMKLTYLCRQIWISDAICRLRTFYNGAGFMSAPGILSMAMPSQGNNYQSNLNPTRGNRIYLMTDEPMVESAVKDKWTPNNSATIKITRRCLPFSGYCAGTNKKLEKSVFFLEVENPDCSTVYTWHIQMADGSWLPYTYGTIRIFYPISGAYTIYLRQDNLGGFPGSPFFATKTDVYYTTNWSPFCCGLNRPDDNVEDIEPSITQLKNFDLTAFNEYLKYKSHPLVDTLSDMGDSQMFDKPQTINIYPNPSNNVLFINGLVINELVNISVTDVLGRQMIIEKIKGSGTPAKVDISGLVPGNYFITLTNIENAGTHSFKFVKN